MILHSQYLEALKVVAQYNLQQREVLYKEKELCEKNRLEYLRSDEQETIFQKMVFGKIDVSKELIGYDFLDKNFNGRSCGNMGSDYSLLVTGKQFEGEKIFTVSSHWGADWSKTPREWAVYFGDFYPGIGKFSYIHEIVSELKKIEPISITKHFLNRESIVKRLTSRKIINYGNGTV